MESRTEGLNSEVTSRPEAVHSGSSSTTDGIILPITGHKLNGQNFIQWAQSVRIFICGKGKEEYLTGAIVQPKEDDPGYRTWKLENSMVMSWLINSMTNDIGENFMYYGTAKEIWDAARETYSNIDNTSAIFEIKSILQDLRQGDSTVTEYFNILTRYWQQLDIYEELVWKCPEDGLLYKKVIEKERIYKFLLGLNKNLDELHEEPNPTTTTTKRRRIVHGATIVENLDTRKRLARHGKPADWKPSRPQQNREGRGYTAAAEEDTSGTSSNPGPFSKEQLEALQKMFQQTLQSTGTTIGTASVAQKGIFFHALNVRQENHTTWIVDSGASDHMTGNLMVFHEYTPCHNNCSVRIADGTLSRALNSGKRIGNAEVRAGLYLLRAEEIRRLPMKTACVVSNPSTKTDSVVMLWHYRLGSRWFVTFVDDHTRVTWVFLMKKKSEVREIFENFNNMVQTQFQAKIQVLRTDNAREYYHNILGSYLLENGIVHQSSCIDTPQQNGVAERKNRHLMEVARSLMIASNVPKQLWGEAVLTATYLINRMPSRILQFKTPCQILLAAYPSARIISSIPIKVFGCTAFVHIHKSQRSKLDPTATKCIFLGYSPNQKGYKCYSPTTKKFYTSMDVTFFENQPFYPKTAIQGENWSTDEFQFWETEISTTSPLSSSLPPQTDTTLSVPKNNSFDVPSVTPESTTQGSKEVIVYSRKILKEKPEKPPQKEPEDSTPPEQNQELDQDPSNPIAQPGNTIYDLNSSNDLDDLDQPIALRKGVRSCTQHPISNHVYYGKLSQNFQAFITSLEDDRIPSNIQEALQQPEWKTAVQEEIQALEKNGTWEISELPEGKRPVGCKWIFTVKHNPDGSINRFKARLVAKGFTQSYGIDYEETFAPVAKLNSIRVLLSVAVNLDWNLHQLDVKNAFLNGELEEEVYMKIPPSMETPENSGKVCKLRKSLYGLKQSPRAWFDRLTRVVKKHGFIQCQADHTLFMKHSKEGEMTLFIVYVDDIIITGDDEEGIGNLKKLLAREFEIKDLGQLRYFLGMEVGRTKEGIVVTQRKYVLDLLQETGMLGCKPVDTPMDPIGKIDKDNDSHPTDKDRYQRLVGKLIYLTHTRPDIGFAVSMVSRYMNNPNERNMKAVYRILQYLKKSPGRGLYFKKTSSREVEVFTDADWAGSLTDRRSTTGYCSYVWGNLVTWRSKKQSVVARSSAEAEFRAMAHGICEGMWLQRILKELGIISNSTMTVLCDNKATISIAKNPVQHDRTKHVEIDRHFIKEKLEGGTIRLMYIPSSRQTADILTKALPKTTYENMKSKLGMLDIYYPT
ncbi:Retrovirus-related Pol polyprotein from transposon TNT 1-94 [Vitis vinifera]|uniref:Retrovirus-related Pol polyprotein from transposon TNT 1-94 n=1 Tax=Vitis vinifera TaxID=29760 RepID=A0A438EXP7_VITVI|nr:Retrovirus-related Pol polyprotein from transposon TNT 1-94 [Vitis vinifera]